MFSLLAMLLVQTLPERPILWGDIPAGISAGEARALRPAGGSVRHREDRIVIDGERVADNCRADVHILHRAGTVDSVVLQGEPAVAALCGDAMLATLRQSLGAPLSSERRRPFMKRARTTYMWRRDGVTLRYVHYAAGSGASALIDATNSSWEMSVSTGSDPVDL